MSLIQMLFKSKEELEQEKETFSQESFPYGQMQQEKLEGLLAELLPEEPAALRRTIFLIGKRAYQADIRQTQEEGLPLQQRLPQTFRVLDKQLFGTHHRKLARYLALIMVDAEVDGDLHYPGIPLLQEMASALGPQCQKTKRSCFFRREMQKKQGKSE